MNRHELISGLRPNGQTIERVLVCVLVLLCLGVGVRIVTGLRMNRSIAGTIQESMEFLESQSGKAKEYMGTYSKKVGKLKEKGAFSVKKQTPSVTGILGDSALMAGKWCKVGDEHAGAKVLKIEPTQVTVLWQEKEFKLAPLAASTINDSKVGRKEKKPKRASLAEGDVKSSDAKSSGVKEKAKDRKLRKKTETATAK